MRYVGVGRRFIAFAIDALIAGMWVTPLSSYTHIGSRYEVRIDGGPAVLAFLLVMLYNVAMELAVGATVGKLIVGVRVVMADGSKITPGASLVRNLLRVVDWLPVFYLVGAIAIWAGPTRQRVGDRAGKTVVIAAGSNAGAGLPDGAGPTASAWPGPYEPSVPSQPAVPSPATPFPSTPPPAPGPPPMPPPPPVPPAQG